jgi:hypothetical protein
MKRPPINKFKNQNNNSLGFRVQCPEVWKAVNQMIDYILYLEKSNKTLKAKAKSNAVFSTKIS